jgi:hypothetical protein
MPEMFGLSVLGRDYERSCRLVGSKKVDLKKWIEAVTYLIDVRKKIKNILYKKVKEKKICFIIFFLFE